MPLASASVTDSSRQSASRDIGTQVSVEIALQPGRDWMAAKNALCRAVHRRVRSSGVLAHSKALPPWLLAISCTTSACSFTPAGEP